MPQRAASQRAVLDFSSLRAEGIALLQRYAGGTWTDHNTHDPGITILEQVCYALTDLAYRAGYELPDLLAREGGDPYASLYTPAQVLPTSPITIDDLRKVVIDVPGVKNAWIDVVDERCATYDAAQREVSYATAGDSAPASAAPSPNISEIRVRGLYRVRIEKSDLVDINASAIRREAARRLHRHRGLGEDFREIKVLDQQTVRLSGTLEIEAVADANALLANVYHRIASYVSPSVPFHTLDEMLERGWRVDQIFEGPLLEQGFIDPDELARAGPRTSLRISDLIHELMSVPGVAAVKNLHFITEGQPKKWLLDIDAGKTPKFEPGISEIHLEKRDLQIDDEAMRTAARSLAGELAKKAARPVRPTERDLRPQPGRDRGVARYFSVQQQFPMVYGIGSAGLPQSAPPGRKAQARQLKAYLMFFDQLLANQFAQLANAAKLFSFHDETPDSYFSQPVQDGDGTLGLDVIRVSEPDRHRELLRQITEDPQASGGKPGALRRSRFLDHLLARFGEQFREYGLIQPESDARDGVTYEERLAAIKRAFLRDLPRIGRDRGTAFDYLEPASDENVSGLELALRRKLGIRDPEERFYLVEHVLLRPIAGDANQRGPLFRDARMRDPYSLQISFVFPKWPARYQDENFLGFVERTIREETPAHLTPHILWKEKPEDMQAFASAHAVWLERWRGHRLAELEL